MRSLLMVVSVFATLSNIVMVSCENNAQLDKQTIQQVESSLLSRFGLNRRPIVNRKKVRIPKAMLDLYKLQTGQNVDTAMLPLPGRHTRSANTVRTFTHQVSNIDMRFKYSNKFRLHFDVTSLPDTEQVLSAELRLSRQTNDQDKQSDTQRIIVKDILHPGIKGLSKPAFRIVDSVLIDRERDGNSISFDVLPAVLRWRKQPEHNHGLLLEITNKNGVLLERNIRPLVVMNPDREEFSQTEWLLFEPLLFLYSDDGRNKRTSLEDLLKRPKRTPNGNVPRKLKKNMYSMCKRHPLYVDFADVGWNDWIVAPPGYDAYVCKGDCPFPLAEHLNSTNHAIVQTLMSSVQPENVPKACCVPTALSAISMLYLDEDNKVVLKTYQDMAVIGCGCR